MDDAVSMGSWAGARVLVLSPTPTHPQDYGNRKRIYQVCRRFTDQGARVTFVHYPAEFEWRATLPWRAERAMIEAWAQYFTVAPTRSLHSGPKGRFHGIDDWWDESIGSFLRWLFSVQSFDAFVVNYSWLSKAFESAPRSVFKILDTHDMLSGRRELLESLGLDAEYFFTTAKEEAIALNRADLVWAIKDEERTAFEAMTDRPVLTLAHLDPLAPVARAAPDPDGYFRVGIIGARNNINRINIGEFLALAEPLFRDAFAPIKVTVAGSICDLLTDIDSPFIDLRGRVDDVEDFYRSLDCVAVPMRLSSGLKIKTGEALSLGMPVVALAHAFEGYKKGDKLHGLADFAAITEALIELSFGPRTRLDALARASERAHAGTSTQIVRTFARSATLAREGGHLIVLAVDSRAFVAGTLFNMMLASMNDYLRMLSGIVVLVVHGSAADVAQGAAAIDRFRRVVVAADLPDTDGQGAALAALGVDVVNVGEFLASIQPRVIIVDALHPALFKAHCPGASVISRTEAIAFSEGGADFELPGPQYRRAFLASPTTSREDAAMQAASGLEAVLKPCFWRSTEIKLTRVRPRGETKTVVLLGDPAAPAVAMAATIARAWKIEPLIVRGFADGDAGGVAALLAGVAIHDPDRYLAALIDGELAPPDFVIDLSAGRLGLGLCREFLERLHVPVVRAVGVCAHPSLDLAVPPHLVRTEGELWRVFQSFAMDSQDERNRAFAPVWRELETDRGWAWVWRYCSRLFEANDAEFA